MNMLRKDNTMDVGEWNSFWEIACHMAWSWRNKKKFEENFTRQLSGSGEGNIGFL